MRKVKHSPRHLIQLTESKEVTEELRYCTVSHNVCVERLFVGTVVIQDAALSVQLLEEAESYVRVCCQTLENELLREDC